MTTLTDKDFIHFEPLEILWIKQEDDVLIIHLPSQPCFSQFESLNKSAERYTNYSVEFVFDQAKMSGHVFNLPLQTDDWELKVNQTSYYCFLPAKLHANGNICFIINHNNQQLKISAINFELRIVNPSTTAINHKTPT